MKKLFFICTLLTIFALSCQTSKKTAENATNFPLCETQWVLTDINGTPAPQAPAVPYIQFTTDGGFSGNLGCNDFFGSYTVNKEKISLEYRGSTKKLCNNMETEKAFSSALKQDITNYEISGDVLTIRAKSQEVLRFKATPKNE